MKLIYIFRALLCDFLMYVSMFIIGMLGRPFFLFSKNADYILVRLFCRSVFLILRVVAGIKVEFRGEIPSGNAIICSKHQSFLDVLMLLYILPQGRFIMKKELIYAPVIGFYARAIGCIPIKRSQKGDSLRLMISALKNINKGQTVIYPQGTRVLPGVKQSYKVGAGVIYAKTNCKCYLAATNTGMFWARRSFFRYPGTAVIEFIGEVPPNMKVADFMLEIESRIERASDNLMNEAKVLRSS